MLFGSNDEHLQGPVRAERGNAHPLSHWMHTKLLCGRYYTSMEAQSLWPRGENEFVTISGFLEVPSNPCPANNYQPDPKLPRGQSYWKPEAGLHTGLAALFIHCLLLKTEEKKCTNNIPGNTTLQPSNTFLDNFWFSH